MYNLEGFCGCSFRRYSMFIFSHLQNRRGEGVGCLFGYHAPLRPNGKVAEWQRRPVLSCRGCLGHGPVPGWGEGGTPVAKWQSGRVAKAPGPVLLGGCLGHGTLPMRGEGGTPVAKWQS